MLDSVAPGGGMGWTQLLPGGNYLVCIQGQFVAKCVKRSFRNSILVVLGRLSRL